MGLLAQIKDGLSSAFAGKNPIKGAANLLGLRLSSQAREARRQKNQALPLCGSSLISLDPLFEPESPPVNAPRQSERIRKRRAVSLDNNIVSLDPVFEPESPAAQETQKTQVEKLDDLITKAIYSQLNLPIEGGITPLQAANLYLKQYGTLSDKNRGASKPYTSAQALAIRFGRQSDPLSQRMAKQIHCTALISAIPYLEKANIAKKIVKRLMTERLEKDGMLIIPIVITDDKANKSHAMYAVIKRKPDNSKLKFYLQNSWPQHGVLCGYVRGETDAEKLENLCRISFARGSYDHRLENSAVQMFGSVRFQAKKAGNPLQISDMIADLRESEKKLHLPQLKPNCHLSGLHLALDVAARINEDNPTIPGLTRDSLAIDVKRLEFANLKSAAKAWLNKAVFAKASRKINEELSKIGAADKDMIRQALMNINLETAKLFPDFPKKEIVQITAHAVKALHDMQSKEGALPADIAYEITNQLAAEQQRRLYTGKLPQQHENNARFTQPPIEYILSFLFSNIFDLATATKNPKNKRAPGVIANTLHHMAVNL